MVPWPIGLLAILYAVLATSSAATVWKAVSGVIGHPVWGAAFWCGISMALVVGLTLLRAWARVLAVWSSVLMVIGTLGGAALAIAQHHPDPARSLVMTVMASAHLLIIRYLTRPRVKAWFSPSGVLTGPE